MPRPPRSKQTGTLFPCTTICRAGMSMMVGMLAEYGALGKGKQPTGGRIAIAAPTNAYPSADGQWVLIAANSEPLFAKLMTLVGQPQLIGAPRYASNPERVANMTQLDTLIGAWTSSEERRVGKECVRPCRSRGSPVH